MSKKCAVRSLSDSALAQLANMIVSTLGYVHYGPGNTLDINIVMVEINKYLEQTGATWNIYQDLLRITLGSDFIDHNMRFTCLQLLLNASVCFLLPHEFPFSYHDKILQVIAAQGTGLRVLILKGNWIKEDHMHYLYDIVRKCKNLTKLIVPNIANDDLLEVMSQHSHHLQILDISGETDITEIGIDLLSKGVFKDTLTAIDVGIHGEENICHSDIALILENCPNVETLTSYSFVGASLKFVHDNVDENFKCKLKYLHDTGTDMETLRVIIKTCPKLESLYLDTPEPGVLYGLSDMFLSQLKVYKFSCDELIGVLAKIGHNLSRLTVVKGTGFLELSELTRACPILIDLDCYMMDGLLYTRDKIGFQCLEGLEMLSSSISDTSLKALICGCTQLKRLAVDSVTFTDEDIISIFVEHDFNALEDIWFTLAPDLTLQSVEILMDRCPELQSIGHLSGWCLSADDLTLLRGLLKSGNSSIVPSPDIFNKPNLFLVDDSD